MEPLDRQPIVEAVVDIDCDMPPKFNLASTEAGAKGVFLAEYPKFRSQLVEEHTIEQVPNAEPRISRRRALQSLQFLHEDEKQLVQVRTPGFSFNRLSPYSSLDDYLPEIERTWRVFAHLTRPAVVRTVRLRYINRLLIPLVGAGVALEDYLKVSPRLPDEDRLVLNGFLHQHSAKETATGHQANIVLTSQPVVENRLPVIFDIQVNAQEDVAIEDWARILELITALRDLKNRIFRNTLTDKCLSLFRAP